MSKEIRKRDVQSWAESQRKSYERLLQEFVETPTVSAQPEHKADIKRGAELAADTIRTFGGKATIIRTAGHPLVYGSFEKGKNLPTVTAYNHIDVQPASRQTEPWETDPFRFVKKGDRYFGRGTTDDKGPALSMLYGAKAAMEHDVPVNIRVLWEFEEEIGSPNFEAALVAGGKKFATDSVIVSDTIWISRKQPACPAGLRGLQGFSLRLQTGETDQHSGTTGGVARNPIAELMKLVSEMFDATTGKVKIKGFYDEVLPPAKAELDEFRRSGFTVKEFKKDHLFSSVRTDDAMDAMKRLWASPTMEIHGVVGGYTGPGIKTIIPAVAEVKVSCRLVKNQHPDRILALIQEFVAQRNPDVEVIPEGRMFPYQAPTTGAYADAVRSSMKFAFGKDPVFVREGGSIGAVISMEQVLQCPVLFLGLSLPEHGYHAPNENYDWQQASGGMVAFAKYFETISRLAR